MVPSVSDGAGTYAFRNCDMMTIYGEKGSYAETYANENGISFVNTKQEELKPLNVEMTENASKWYFDVSVEGYSEEATAYVAIYDNNNKLLTLISDVLMIDDLTTLSISKSGIQGASYARVFVWKNDFSPVTPSEKIEF